MFALLISHWFYIHCIAALLSFPSASANCLHGTTLYKRSLLKRATTPFGYTDRLSALNWGNLDPLYSVCETGIYQSPINLDDTISYTPSNPEINIPILMAATVENTGVLVEVPYPSSVNGTAIYDGITYRLVQFHFHTPGEHRVNELFFPAEMHMVLEGVDDASSILVMAALLELDTCPGLPFIDSIIAGLPAISARGSNTSIGEIDLSPVIDVLSKSSRTFAYTGSLTQPPCTEGVKWVIPQHTFPITVHQFNALKSVCKFNSRYTQNKLGDGNLLQIAKGNDTDPAETKQQESQVKRRATN